MTDSAPPKPPLPALGTPRNVVERWIRLVVNRDFSGVLELNAGRAAWEIYLPDWDGLVLDASEMRRLYDDFFGHDAFRVDRHHIAAEAGVVALRWDLSWRDPSDGARCVSFQSQFFEVRGQRIHRHAMYCSGVRVFAPTSQAIS